MSTTAFEDLNPGTVIDLGDLVEIAGSALRGEDYVLRMTFIGMFATRG